MKKFLSFMLTLLTLLTFGATLNVNAAEGTDVLTVDSLGITEVYNNYQSKAFPTGATYSTFAMKSQDNEIQMNNNKKNRQSGIVVTKSAGLVASIKFTPGKSNKNSIEIYGSHVPYTAAADLFDATKAGTKLHTLTKAETFQLNENYEYIGLKNVSGATYTNSFEITWKDAIVGTAYETNFNLNDGTTEKIVVTTAENKTVTFPTPDPVREGYTFTGWYDAAEGGNQITTLTATADSVKQLYAHWEAKPVVTIAFDYNDGLTPAISQNGYLNDDVVFPTEPTREGYKFLGWFDDAIAGNQVTTLKYTTNMTLYGRWEKLASGASEVDFAKNTIAGGTIYADPSEVNVNNTKFTMHPGMSNKATVILGANNNKSELLLTDLSRFNITNSKGAYIEPADITNNVKEVIYTVQSKNDGNWKIVFIDANNAIKEISSGVLVAKQEDKLIGTLPTAETGKFILVCYGDATVNEFRVDMVRYSLSTEVAAVEPKFEEVQTRASLVVSYDDQTRVATNVKLRFGGVIDSKLYDQNKEYGLIIIPGTDADDLSALTNEQFEAYKAKGYVLTFTHEQIAQVNEGYQFSAVIKNVQGHYDFQFRAVMYMKDATSITTAKESKNSVLTVRDTYLKNPNLSSLYDVLNSIK